MESNIKVVGKSIEITTTKEVVEVFDEEIVDREINYLTGVIAEAQSKLEILGNRKALFSRQDILERMNVN